jgi:small multidrug resistance family-3 protein
MKTILERLALYGITALAEISGCYAVYAWLRLKQSPWWLLPGAISLGLFAWLLTLHPAAAGRTYAAYGCVYIAASLIWLKWVDGHQPDRWDLIGALVCAVGAAIMVIPHSRN